MPVGLIASSWGGTRAEAWTSRPALDAVPFLAKDAAEWDKRIAAFDLEKAREAYQQRYEKWQEDAAKARHEGRPVPPNKPALDNPEKAVKDLKVVFPEVNEKLAAAELAAITPLFCSGGAKYIGKAEDALWAKSQDLLAEVKLLPAGQDPKSYYTIEFLPPVAQMRACK